MKIVICGSMTSSKKMIEAKQEMERLGHQVELPRNAEKYVNGELAEEDSKESIENKVKDDLIRDYYKKIKEGDAILVVNESKKGIENYIGGNVFLEIGFAHVLGKKIYLLSNIPEMSYADEIIAMQPVIINGNYDLIRNENG